MEVPSLLLKVVVRLKSEVYHPLTLFNIVLTCIDVVACSMASAGFAACMGASPETILQVGYGFYEHVTYG